MAGESSKLESIFFTAFEKPTVEERTAYLDQAVEVLVEGRHKGRWRGRNPQGKLVFFDDNGDWRGQLVPVHVTYTGPWSMSGQLVGRRQDTSKPVESIPLALI